MTDPPRKLIEVALPLEAINRESAREKSIRHGHPSTLHMWWARRPLAACRAVLFAQMVDDPSAHPERFGTEEAQDAERQRLFAIIEDLVRWENITNEEVLEAARAEIRACYDGHPPPVLDPFAGGGSIPLEAQRLGLEAHASDLNPVAVLINKALIEIPPRFAGRPPVHPEATRRTHWSGAQGLAEDVRRYGAQMRDEAQRRIGHLYPPATLPDGTTAAVIAWIWARTVTCPNPACRSTMPLVRSFWLGKKKGKEAWVDPIADPDAKGVRFQIGHGPQGPPVEGTVTRNGAICLICNSPATLSHVRGEGKAGRMGAKLMAIVAEGRRQRTYLAPTDEHEKAADVPRPADAPDTELPEQALGFRVQGYGMTHHADLFTPRQLTALFTLSALVTEARRRLITDGAESDYADAIATYLAFVLAKVADRNSSICGWDSSPKMESIRNTFARQAIPMNWDFAESAVFGSGAGNILDATDWVALVLERLCGVHEGRALMSDARQAPVPVGGIVSTDPPYYDNVGYADLSDFFYIWLRRSLLPYYPDLLATVLTPKAAELVADPFRPHAGYEDADRFFEHGFEDVFANLTAHIDRRTPVTVYYAFKQSEQTDAGVASTGWETMLAGLLRSGLAVSATWPMRTELGNRMRNLGSNALASSIVLACRPRPQTAAVTDRRGLLTRLHAELPQALRNMQKGNIAPVDLAQAAIGPGMGVFSGYRRVIEADGTDMTVRAALGLINQVLDEVLAEQEGEFDAETRWAIKWFEQFGFDEGAYGVAEVLATATGTAVAAMEHSGILSSRAGKVRLLDRDDLPTDWDPVTDLRTPVWEVTMHLARTHQSEGEGGAADLLRRVGAVGDVARDLAYRLYSLCEKKHWAADALVFNSLVTSWPEIASRAAEPPSVRPDEVAVQGRMIE